MSTQQSLHALSMPDIDTTFPSTVPVAGEASYGVSTVTHPENTWMANIGQDICLDYFDYTTSSESGTILFDKNISLYLVNNTPILPWHIWFVSQYQSWSCEYDLILKPVKHSAHRGAISVSCTLNTPTDKNTDSSFLPIKIFDISGDTDGEYVYSIPSVYAFSTKTNFEQARNLINFGSSVPKYTYNLTWLRITSVVPLVSSSLLPSTITFKVILRPNIKTFSVGHPLLPSYHRIGDGRISTTWNNV